jgi:hypothetical protein
VANLPNGFYYLHVLGGAINNSIRQQVIIRN